MGTRCLTRVFDRDQEILCLYRQCDGYVSGHGQDLADFLTSRRLVNGFGEDNLVFNGMGCLAAQLVSALKGQSAGNIYIKAAGTTDVGEEYVYEVRGGLSEHLEPTPLTVKVSAYGETLYEGDLSAFAHFVSQPEAA